MNRDDLIKQNEEQRKKENRILLSLIPYFHGVFARTKNPDALEVAKNLGKALTKLT